MAGVQAFERYAVHRDLLYKNINTVRSVFPVVTTIFSDYFLRSQKGILSNKATNAVRFLHYARSSRLGR